MESDEHTELLLAYTGGKLDPPRVEACERHLEACVACRQFVAGQRVVWAALDDWEAPPVSAAFERELYQRIESEISWWDRVRRNVYPFAVRQLVPVAAVACLTIVAGVMLYRPRPAAPEPGSAQIEAIQPEQIEHVLDDMQILRDFDRAVNNDGSSEL